MKAFRDERGQATIMMALMMGTFLLAFVGFAVDVQYLFQQKRIAQAAADAAAIAAAEEATAGNSGNEQTVANAIAKLNGMDPGAASNPATVTLSTPSSANSDGSSSNYVANSFVQATVTKPVPTFFMGILNHSTMNVSATAVAGDGLASPSCICLLGTSGMDLNISNNGQISVTNCGITVNSNSSNAVQVIGSGGVNALSLGSVSSNWYPSGVNNGGTVHSTKIVQGLTSTCGVTVPAVPTYNAAQCTVDPLNSYGNGGSSYSVGPGTLHSTTQGASNNLVCYNSLTVGTNNDRVNMTAGIYVINGGELHFESGANNQSNTGGNGVTFYLTNGASLVIDNGANVNLTAPTSGTYANALVLEDPGDSSVPRAADTQPISIQGGSNASMTGVIYATQASVTLGNGSNTTINAEVVAQSLTLTGGTTLSSSDTVNLGSLNISTAKVTE